MNTPEQQARDLLDRMGIEGAQQMTAGDVGELAALIEERDDLRQAAEQALAVLADVDEAEMARLRGFTRPASAPPAP